MPCMGPTVSEAQVNSAYEEIMQLLRVKYRVQDSQPFCMLEYYRGYRNALNNSLKDVIRALLLNEACECF